MEDQEQRLETSLRRHDDVSVVDVRGEIDLATVPQFKEAVSAAAEQSSHVVINLADVTYMDSSGFGTLLSANRRLRPEGGSLYLVGCNEIIQRMLSITRLNTIFSVHESEDDALRAIPGNGSAAPMA